MTQESTENELLEKVGNVIMEVLKVKTVLPESRFAEDLGADSLDRISLLMALEEEFKTEISEDEASGLLRVRDVLDLIRRRSGKEIGKKWLAVSL